MRAILRITVLLLLSSITFATDFTVSWTPPTQYEDGATLLEQDLDFYTFYCDGNRIVDLDSIVGTWTAIIAFTEPGTYVCGLTVTDLNGEQSDLSNTKVFMKGPRKPRPPTLQ